MARLKSGIPFTGSIGGISAFTLPGSNEIFIKSKGGPNAKQIKSKKSFEGLRRRNTEFGAASTAAKYSKQAMAELSHLDHSYFQSRLTSLFYSLLRMNPVGEIGQRSLLISRYRHFLEGFNLEMGILFDSLVKSPLDYRIDRENLSALIRIPELVPRLNLYIPGNYPMFRIVACLGALSDLQYDTSGRTYLPVHSRAGLKHACSKTDWLSGDAPSAARELSLQITGPISIDDTCSLQLAIGIEFGVSATNTLVKVNRNAGAAKILAMG